MITLATLADVTVILCASVSSSSAVFDLAHNANAFKNTETFKTAGTNTLVKEIYWQKEDESVEKCGYAYVKRDDSFPSTGPYSARNTITVIIYFTSHLHSFSFLICSSSTQDSHLNFP